MALSTDLAQRSVIIKLDKAEYSGTWKQETFGFIETHRGALIADIAAFFQNERWPMAQASRWGAWEYDVVSRLPEPSEAQAVILERQAECDADGDDGAMVDEYVAEKLEGFGYNPDRTQVRIPNRVLAFWFVEAMGEPMKTTAVTRRLNQMATEGQIKRLKSDPCRSYGRCFIYTGPDANVLADPSPGDIGLIAGTLLDLAKATGTDDARTNLGYLAAIGAAGRVVDLRAQASNLSPGIIGTLAFGGDFRTSGAAIAALTNAGADFQGARTGTGLISLAQQLEKFDKENDSFDAESLGGRIAALQNNQGLAQTFLSGASFEKQVSGVIRNLLTDANSVAAQQYVANLQSLPSLSELAKRGDRAIEVLDVANPLATTAKVGRTVDQLIESQRLRGRRDQLSREQITGIEEILQRNGAFATESELSTFTSRLGGDGVTVRDASGLLRSRASALRAGETVGFGGGFGGGGSAFVPASDDEKRAADRLDEVADRLLTLIEATHGTTTAVKNQRAGIPIR